jgi:eukaryotic-like serine/threonine-protein kinase
MKFKLPFQDGTLGSLLATIGLVFGTLFLIAIGYFYVYLPHITNHGESVTVPNIQGMKIDEVEEFLTKHDLRYSVNDSAYSENYPPLAVLQQFPKAGANVKEGRMIYVSINRVTPPTLPLPDLTENFSLTGAELIIKSNELKRGKVFYRQSPFMNLVLEMRYEGKVISPNTRVPKGAVIDLVVGDGHGPADFVLGSLINDSYERALFKLEGWNLHLGNIEIPAGTDTTGVELFVFKQSPSEGDSIRVGEPVDIWIAPKGYKADDTENDGNK